VNFTGQYQHPSPSATAKPASLPRAERPAGTARPLVAAIALACVALLPGCANLYKAAANFAQSVSGEDPLAGLGEGTNTSGVQLARVQLNTFNPSSTLDLIGDGSGALGQNCLPTSDGSTCTCAYSYIQADGTQIGPIEVKTDYTEADLIRCKYDVIPAGVAFVDVHIHFTNSDTTSNTRVFRLNAAAASGIDLSNPSSFTHVTRYQCRDIVTIPYLWDDNIYDPFLSEDPRFSYPLNFYTTNMGLTMFRYTASDISKFWNCPAIPNDTSAGMDLTLYSIAADASGSKSIFPPTGSFDRSTFYVANAQAGIFTLPVHAYSFPGGITSITAPTGGVGQAASGAGNGTSLPPLGFAASPIPLSGGGETCPDASVSIPSGYHWAKLWLFRRQLPQRSYPSSNTLKQFGQANGTGAIACNPGAFSSTNPANLPFPDCRNQPSTQALSPTGMAARFSETTGSCFNITPGGTTDPLTGLNFDGVNSSSPIHPGLDFTPFAAGTDIWVPARQDPNLGCGGSSANDLSRACQNSSGNVPFDATIPTPSGLIDVSTADPRFDFVYVVSPPSVNRQDMVSTSSSTTHSIYTPLRFMSPTDCRSSDPDQPSFPGDCSPSRMISYQLTVNQVNAPSQSGGNDPDGPGVFPMCVLQPD
jgi:hypothetical protein